MNVTKVLQEMMELHPCYKEELAEAIAAYDRPLGLFQEREAEWRLKECFRIESTTDNYQDMYDEILIDFDKSDYFVDGETIHQIVEDVVSKYQISIQTIDDQKKLENQKNPFISLENSNLDSLSRIICNIKDCDSLKIYDAIVKSLKTISKNYISVKELHHLYADVVNIYG